MRPAESWSLGTWIPIGINTHGNLETDRKGKGGAKGKVKGRGIGERGKGREVEGRRDENGGLRRGEKGRKGRKNRKRGRKLEGRAGLTSSITSAVCVQWYFLAIK